MSWIDRLKAFAGLRPVYSTFELNAMRRYGARPDMSFDALVGLNHSWVYACALRNATTAAGVDLNVYAVGSDGTDKYHTRALTLPERRGLSADWHRRRIKSTTGDDVVELEDHPLAVLLDKANSNMTGPELFELTWAYLELTGNAYWYLERQEIGGAGVPARSVPIGLWPLMSQYVKVVPDEANIVAGYLYGKSDRDAVAYDRSEIIHFRYPNPRNLLYGMGPAQAAACAARRMEARSEYEQAMWDNDATPTLGISIEGNLSPESRKRLLEQFRQTYGGPQNKGKPIVLEGGMTVAPIGMAPQDTQMLENARFSREEIAAVFGVPMTLLEMSDANRASAEAGNTSYLAQTIVPRLARMESKLNEELCPLFDDSGRLFVQFDDPVPENVQADLDARTRYIQVGVLSPNEVRAEMGLGPRDGGDEYKAAASQPPQLQPGAQEPQTRAYHPQADACECPTCKAASPFGAEGQEPLSESERTFAAVIGRFYGDRVDEVAGRLGD